MHTKVGGEIAIGLFLCLEFCYGLAMERSDWLKIQQEFKDKPSQSIHHETEIATVVLLTEILDRLDQIQQALKQLISESE
jgi:hypothetical protein